MMKLFHTVVPAVFTSILFSSLIISPSAMAQKRKLISGSMEGLKEYKSYDIKFTYDYMIVGEKSEKQFLQEKRKVWEEKEPGQGSAFVQQWFYARKDYYEPTFIKAFEEVSKIKLGDKEAKYTLIVKTLKTNGGWGIGVAAGAGDIGGEMWIVESADENKVVARIAFSDFLGKVFTNGDFEMTNRINSAYALAGQGLGDFIKRKAK